MGSILAKMKKFKEELANKNIYNAFILPYSKEKYVVLSLKDEEKKYLNIGKAVSEWKSNNRKLMRMYKVYLSM